ncbi:MAG: hypothetical protein IKP69_00035, partial [Oscillospiraceae bacterium]|nr:hypothetical protein [Oscillospiraceae bacterium]
FFRFEIENPLGCPSMICDAEQILNLLIEGKSFIFEVERYVQIKVCSEEMLIKELIKLLESHAILTVAEQFRCIQKSVKNKVRFQYGLISYIQSRYHYCEFFSLNKKVQEQLSLIDVTDGTAIDEKIRNTELYFMEALYEAGRKV